ncbi:MAG: helix-turn-helix domain-containing protein [Ruminococcus sp.]|nr:helix-turn-helix domain-containing protein [Ruminococcus sp.]
MNFANNLDLYMNKLGISNYQMSKETGISDSLIGYWRNGKRKPNLENLIVLSDYLNVSIDNLVRKNASDDSSILFDSFQLSEGESELLDTYRSLDSRGKHRVHTIIYEELDRMASSNVSVKNTG